MTDHVENLKRIWQPFRSLTGVLISNHIKIIFNKTCLTFNNKHTYSMNSFIPFNSALNNTKILYGSQRRFVRFFCWYQKEYYHWWNS